MIGKKVEHEVCGYWPNARCHGRVVGYSIIESQRDDRRVALCWQHFHDAQRDNQVYQERMRAVLHSAR